MGRQDKGPMTCLQGPVDRLDKGPTACLLISTRAKEIIIKQVTKGNIIQMMKAMMMMMIGY